MARQVGATHLRDAVNLLLSKKKEWKICVYFALVYHMIRNSLFPTNYVERAVWIFTLTKHSQFFHNLRLEGMISFTSSRQHPMVRGKGQQITPYPFAWCSWEIGLGCGSVSLVLFSSRCREGSPDLGAQDSGCLWYSNQQRNSKSRTFQDASPVRL